MGLFSSAKKIPQPPLPIIDIHLYNPSERVHRPDDLVTGHISFTPVAPIAPRALEVSLFGQSLIWYRTSHKNSSDSTDYYHWRDNAPLFEVATNVLPAYDSKATTLEVGVTYKFPFSFRFPAGTSNSRVGQYKEDGNELWTVTAHDLPPSFLIHDKYGNDKSPNYCKVEYGVRARLICPGIGIVKGPNIEDFVFDAPLLFAPLGITPDALVGPVGLTRHCQNFTLRSSTLAGQSTQSVGFRQSMRDRFSSSTPALDFSVVVEVPEILTTGSEFRFRASFNVITKSDNVSHIPAIHFTILKLELKDITWIRAPRDREASTWIDGHHRNNKYKDMPPPNAPFSGQEHQYCWKRDTHLNTLPDSANLELEEIPSGEKKATEQANSCEVMFTARVPGSTPPNFRSFAINRSYQIKVTLGVEVGGKKFEHKVKSGVRQIVAGPMQHIGDIMDRVATAPIKGLQ